jgi:hypothetical protein
LRYPCSTGKRQRGRKRRRRRRRRRGWVRTSAEIIGGNIVRGRGRELMALVHDDGMRERHFAFGIRSLMYFVLAERGAALQKSLVKHLDVALRVGLRPYLRMGPRAE